MAWLSALACDAVAAQDQGRVAPFQPPLSSSALIDLLALAISRRPFIQAQIALLNAAQQGLSNARWQFIPTPSISVQGPQSRGSNPAYMGKFRLAVHVVTVTVDMLTAQHAGLNKFTKPIPCGLTGALNER
jgi:outer membrane protein TolC